MGYDMNFGFFAYGRSREVDWTLCKSSCYPYDFDAEVVSRVKATFERGLKLLNDGEKLTNR